MIIPLKKIKLARDYGFCMGVKRAIKIAEETGRTESGPVSVVNEIVHNDSVVKKLADEGVGSVPSVADAPGGTVIVSAHGAPPLWFKEADEKGLKVIDATCPLVIRIHKIIHRLIANGYHIVHYGDSHHDETKGVFGQAPPGRISLVRSADELGTLPRNGRCFALTSQTTADVADFEAISAEAKELFPDIEIFNTICDATSRRQAAVLDLAPEVEMMLVVGSSSSANSQRLRNISKAICQKAYLINTAECLDISWFEGVATVGITAGASTPDFLVTDVIDRLVEWSGGAARVVRPRRKSRRNVIRRKSLPKNMPKKSAES